VLKRDPHLPLSLDAARALDRRGFLCAAGIAAVGALVGDAVARRIVPAPPPGSVRIPGAAPLAPGTVKVVSSAAGGEVLMVRLADETVVAFDRRCPHLGCPVVWAAERERFECPCHHAAFDARTGRPLHGPPRHGLTPVEVRS
jgi:nitrite reductase/ring-hydroxylating ferredoxin subunit